MAALAGLAGALLLSGCDPYEFPVFVTGAEKIDSWEVDERGWWHAQLPEGTKSSHFFVNGQRRARPHVPCGGCFCVDDMPAHTNSERLVVRAREALGEPGDWHLDSSGELTYVPMPGENPATAEAYLCVRDNIVVIDGATNLVVRGVTFAYTDWNMTDGGQALSQSVANASAAVGCEFSDLGAGGVKIGCAPEVAEGPRSWATGCVVEQCLVEHGGRSVPAGAGLWIGNANRCRLSRNTIRDMYCGGISCGWTRDRKPSGAHHNLMEFNDISDIGQRRLKDVETPPELISESSDTQE